MPIRLRRTPRCSISSSTTITRLQRSSELEPATRRQPSPSRAAFRRRVARRPMPRPPTRRSTTASMQSFLSTTLPVDPCLHRQPSVRECVERDDPRSDSRGEMLPFRRAKACRHLPELDIAGAEVVQNRQPENVCESLLRIEIAPASTDDDPEFEFIVHLPRVRRPRNLVVRTDEGLSATHVRDGQLVRGRRDRAPALPVRSNEVLLEGHEVPIRRRIDRRYKGSLLAAPRPLRSCLRPRLQPPRRTPHRPPVPGTGSRGTTAATMRAAASVVAPTCSRRSRSAIRTSTHSAPDRRNDDPRLRTVRAFVSNPCQVHTRFRAPHPLRRIQHTR